MFTQICGAIKISIVVNMCKHDLPVGPQYHSVIRTCQKLMATRVGCIPALADRGVDLQGWRLVTVCFVLCVIAVALLALLVARAARRLRRACKHCFV